MVLTVKLSPIIFLLTKLRTSGENMLEQAFTEEHYENTILHSNQGWQYQHDSYNAF